MSHTDWTDLVMLQIQFETKWFSNNRIKIYRYYLTSCKQLEQTEQIKSLWISQSRVLCFSFHRRVLFKTLKNTAWKYLRCTEPIVSSSRKSIITWYSSCDIDISWETAKVIKVIFYKPHSSFNCNLECFSCHETKLNSPIIHFCFSTTAHSHTFYSPLLENI